MIPFVISLLRGSIFSVPHFWRILYFLYTNKTNFINKKAQHTFQIFKIAFTSGCAIASLAFVIKLIIEYSLNKDTSSLEFKAFHSDENSVYPSVSLCFSCDLLPCHIFTNNEEEDPDVGISWNDKYRRFLSGCKTTDEFPGPCENGTWDASYADVDYDNVTLRIDNYLLNLGENNCWTTKYAKYILTKWK